MPRHPKDVNGKEGEAGHVLLLLSIISDLPTAFRVRKAASQRLGDRPHEDAPSTLRRGGSSATLKHTAQWPLYPSVTYVADATTVFDYPVLIGIGKGWAAAQCLAAFTRGSVQPSRVRFGPRTIWQKRLPCRSCGRRANEGRTGQDTFDLAPTNFSRRLLAGGEPDSCEATLSHGSL